MKILFLLSLLQTAAPVQQRAVPADPNGEPISYVEKIPGSEVSFEMIALPGGSFQMGSPATEEDRKKDEGPRHLVTVSPFWIEVHEVTWDEYELYNRLPVVPGDEAKPTDGSTPGLDAFSRPTPPYVPMDFGMGTKNKPAVCMTQFAAKQYTQWLSEKTGHFYRLPTEAEWEYACRAGTTTAYSWGDDPDLAEEYAWSFDNADDGYREIMQLKPNSWGLYDMHGNVSEWTLDPLVKTGYGEELSPSLKDPLSWPTELYPRVVRGGSWDDDLDRLRSAARRGSSKSWKIQDPQLPKSIWYHTDASFVGFRVVRPVKEPTDEEKRKYWAADLDSIRRILARQRTGER